MFHRRRSHHWIRAIVCLAAIGTAAGLIIHWISRRRREQEELDQFLLEAPAANGTPSSVQHDLESFLHFADKKQINLTFTFDDAAQAKAFMDDIARSGCSSLLDENNGLVDVFLSGVMDEEEFNSVINAIVGAVDRNQGRYRGFVVE